MRTYLARFCAVQRSCAEVPIVAASYQEACAAAEQIRTNPGQLKFQCAEDDGIELAELDLQPEQNQR